MSPAEKRRQWAYVLLSRAATPPPTYGSPEWLRLPDGPLKVAAVVIAAEAWATDGENYAERLELEIDAARRADKLAEDAEWAAHRDQWRREWSDKSYRPHPANRVGGEL